MTSMILNLILSFLVIYLAYKQGWRDRERHMIRNMAENPDIMLEALQKVKELERKDMTEVVVEEDGPQFFVYNKQTHQFLGQGPSVDDAMMVVCERFPDQYFIIEQ